MKKSRVRIKKHVLDAAMFNTLFMSTLLVHGDSYQNVVRNIADGMQAGIMTDSHALTPIFERCPRDHVKSPKKSFLSWVFSERMRRVAVIVVCAMILFDIVLTVIDYHR